MKLYLDKILVLFATPVIFAFVGQKPLTFTAKSTLFGSYLDSLEDGPPEENERFRWEIPSQNTAFSPYLGGLDTKSESTAEITANELAKKSEAEITANWPTNETVQEITLNDLPASSVAKVAVNGFATKTETEPTGKWPTNETAQEISVSGSTAESMSDNAMDTTAQPGQAIMGHDTIAQPAQGIMSNGTTVQSAQGIMGHETTAQPIQPAQEITSHETTAQPTKDIIGDETTVQPAQEMGHDMAAQRAQEIMGHDTVAEPAKEIMGAKPAQEIMGAKPAQEIMGHDTTAEPAREITVNKPTSESIQEITDNISTNESVQDITVYGSTAQSTAETDNEDNNMVVMMDRLAKTQLELESLLTILEKGSNSLSTSSGRTPPKKLTLWHELSQILVQGGSLRTWEHPYPTDRVEVTMSTKGRPLDACVELWQGPDNSPVNMKTYVEDGCLRPFYVVMETLKRPNEIAIRNLGQMECPFHASVSTEVDDSSHELAMASSGMKIQGNSIKTFPFDTSVDRVQVLLKTNGRPLNARVELLQGPNNIKQVIELHSEDGLERPFYAVFETPGSGNVVQVVNTASFEFPLIATVEPFSKAKKHHKSEEEKAIKNQDQDEIADTLQKAKLALKSIKDENVQLSIPDSSTTNAAFFPQKRELINDNVERVIQMAEMLDSVESREDVSMRADLQEQDSNKKREKEYLNWVQKTRTGQSEVSKKQKPSGSVPKAAADDESSSGDESVESVTKNKHTESSPDVDKNKVARWISDLREKQLKLLSHKKKKN